MLRQYHITEARGIEVLPVQKLEATRPNQDEVLLLFLLELLQDTLVDRLLTLWRQFMGERHIDSATVRKRRNKDFSTRWCE